MISLTRQHIRTDQETNARYNAITFPAAVVGKGREGVFDLMFGWWYNTHHHNQAKLQEHMQDNRKTLDNGKGLHSQHLDETGNQNNSPV